MKSSVIKKIIDEKIIVIVRGVGADKLPSLAQAMYDGGIRLIEITYSADGKERDESVAGSIGMLAKLFEDKMIVGAGTVLTEHQVELTYNAGGKFIISPDVNAEIIKKSRELGMVSIPGAMTPTEVQTAHRCGADFVKLFPVSCVGPGYVRAIKAPLSHVRLLGVGGVDENNMKEYYNKGICGFGVGANIIDRKALEANDFEAITKAAEKYVSALRNV